MERGEVLRMSVAATAGAGRTHGRQRGRREVPSTHSLAVVRGWLSAGWVLSFGEFAGPGRGGTGPTAVAAPRGTCEVLRCTCARATLHRMYGLCLLSRINNTHLAEIGVRHAEQAEFEHVVRLIRQPRKDVKHLWDMVFVLSWESFGPVRAG